MTCFVGLWKEWTFLLLKAVHQCLLEGSGLQRVLSVQLSVAGLDISLLPSMVPVHCQCSTGYPL